MGKAIAFNSMPNGLAPANVLAISASGVINPISGVITLTVSVTPPASGAFAGCHLYIEIPDVSAGPDYTVGTSAIGGTDTVSGNWAPFDLGLQPYVEAQQPWIVSFPAPPFVNPSDTPPLCRLYGASYTALMDNALVRAGLSGATPSQTLTIASLASGEPTSGSGVTVLVGSSGGRIAIAAAVLSPVNVTGKLETPVLVTVSDTPNTPGWVAQLVLTVGASDPTLEANQQPIPGYITQAGPVYAPAADGILIPHSFALDTPKALTQGTIWLQAGLMDADGNYQWNHIVPGITPAWPISYGSTTGTTDASSVMQATIASTMAVVGGLFGVAAAGITNPYLGSGAVATLNIQNLAVTNPLLGALAVDSANLANSAATSTKIANLAVGTAAMQLLAADTSIIANLAASNAKIGLLAVSNANLGYASVANANIGSLAVAQGNIALLAVGTAQLQDLSVTDAKIASLSVNKLAAGTVSVAVTLTSPSIHITSGTKDIYIDGTNSIKVTDSANNKTVTIAGTGVRVANSFVPTIFSEMNDVSIYVTDGAAYTNVATNEIMVSDGGSNFVAIRPYGISKNGVTYSNP